MRSKCLVLIVPLLIILISSCVGTRSSVTQVSDESYLVFYGKQSMTLDEYGNYVKNIYEAKIDDRITFNVELSKRRKDSFHRSSTYKISPGRHSIKVYKNGKLIINKDIYIGNRETMEFEIM